MTYEEKFGYWEKISEYDFETARDMIKAERWIYVASTCYTSVCRFIKGLIIYHTHKESPKSDNLIFLLGRLAQSTEFKNSDAYPAFVKDKDEYLDLMADLTFYHISDYPFSYQKINDRFIDKNTATEVYEKSSRIISWLKIFAPHSL